MARVQPAVANNTGSSSWSFRFLLQCSIPNVGQA